MQNLFCIIQRMTQNVLRSTDARQREGTKQDEVGQIIHRDCYFMKCVYLLQSLSTPSKRYIGKTSNLEQRLAEHNAGKSLHTAKYLPWEVIVAIHSENDLKAEAFERYLKQGTGHAFAKRHFW